MFFGGAGGSVACAGGVAGSWDVDEEENHHGPEKRCYDGDEKIWHDVALAGLDANISTRFFLFRVVRVLQERPSSTICRHFQATIGVCEWDESCVFWLGQTS